MDSENRLVKYEHLPTDISTIDITATYKYDIYGRRIQKNVNGSTNYPPILADLIGLSPKGTIINFFWEGDNLSMELDASNQPLRKYFTELGIDEYFGHIEYGEVTNWSKIFDYSYPQGWYGYLKDQVGTIYRVWDRNLKQYAETRTYDTFGNLINHTGSTKTNLEFQSKYYDSESGLNYFYHRYYSPSIGRFISEDPIGLKGGNNLFKFGINAPIMFKDQYGLISGEETIIPHPMSPIEFYDYFGNNALGKTEPFGNVTSSCEPTSDGKWHLSFNFWLRIHIFWKTIGGSFDHEMRHIRDMHIAYDFNYQILGKAEKLIFSKYCSCIDAGSKFFQLADRNLDFAYYRSILLRDPIVPPMFLIEWMY